MSAYFGSPLYVTCKSHPEAHFEEQSGLPVEVTQAAEIGALNEATGRYLALSTCAYLRFPISRTWETSSMASSCDPNFTADFTHGRQCQ
jgi:hypothetical protein